MAGETPVVAVAMCSKAYKRRESAARTAVALPKTLWVVGLPRRRSSLSIEGRSSWTSDMVWIISTAHAAGMAAEWWPPTSSQAAMQSVSVLALC
ncbi:unnamed protein product [Camellia sinensis]